MNILSGNSRGLGQPLAVQALCELIRTRQPNVIFLFETLSHSARIEEVRVKLNFQNSFCVDCIGRSGGICVFWKSSSSISLINYSQNHIDLKIEEDGIGNWRFMGFYGFPERSRRQNSWALLRHLSTVNSLPWVCIGNFNDLLCFSDKRGRVDHPNWLYSEFKDIVSDSNLFDLPLFGYQFTWSRSKGSINSVEERLDRAMANPVWSSLFPYARLSHLVAPISDHNPIFLEIAILSSKCSYRSFHFENKWLSKTDLPSVIEKSSNAYKLGLLEKLSSCSESLSVWGNHIARAFRTEKEYCEKEIKRLQVRTDIEAASLLSSLRKRFTDVLSKEESYWQQRAKVFWLRDGDFNTKFFHAMASMKRKNNKVQKLKNEDGYWIFDT